MKLNFHLDGDFVSVKTDGKITQQDIAANKEPLAGLLGPDIYKRTVLLDMSNSDYIDSSGISWLLATHKKFREAGGSLVLHSLSPMVSQTIRVMRMEQVLHVAPNPTAARALACGAVQ